MTWRVAHIGFEGDDVQIGGHKVWRHDWRSVDLEPVNLQHPAYPNQIHRYYVYEIGAIDSPVRFAAGELSNGVWGFYAPA
jgi:hypothetical protein